MDENGSFSHHEATLQQIVEYAERLEVTEQRYGGTRRALPLRKMAIRAIHRAEALRAVLKWDQLTAVETVIRNRTKLAIAMCMGPIAGIPVISARS